MIGARSGVEPSRFDAPGNVTHFVRSSMSSMTLLGRQLPGRRVERCQHVLRAGSLGGAPPRRDVGVVVEACSDDPIARLQRRADRPRDGERQRRHVRAEADAGGVGAEQLADGDRVRSINRWHSSAAANGPPLAAVFPLAIHSLIAVMAESTICVPAGPSKRAHSGPIPGNRCRSDVIARVECLATPRVP